MKSYIKKGSCMERVCPLESMNVASKMSRPRMMGMSLSMALDEKSGEDQNH